MSSTTKLAARAVGLRSSVSRQLVELLLQRIAWRKQRRGVALTPLRASCSLGPRETVQLISRVACVAERQFTVILKLCGLAVGFQGQMFIPQSYFGKEPVSVTYSKYDRPERDDKGGFGGNRGGGSFGGDWICPHVRRRDSIPSSLHTLAAPCPAMSPAVRIGGSAKRSTSPGGMPASSAETLEVQTPYQRRPTATVIVLLLRPRPRLCFAISTLPRRKIRFTHR
eukprot:COSAG02_NODE_736_length_17865_cov_9.190420_18_plen_225_part_00